MTAPSLRSLGTPVTTATSTPSFAAPAGAVSTDVILIGFFLDDGRTTVTAVPSNFTLAPNLPQVNDATAGSPSHGLYVYWGRFSDVGAGPYGFTVSGSVFVEGRSAAIQGCITTGSPFEATSGATSGNTSVTTAPSVSATSLGIDRYAAYWATNWTGGAWTPPAGWAEQWDANDEIITFDDLALPTAQTVTPQAVCVGNNRSNAWVGILLPVAGASQSTPVVVTQGSLRPPRGQAVVLAPQNGAVAAVAAPSAAVATPYRRPSDPAHTIVLAPQNGQVATLPAPPAVVVTAAVRSAGRAVVLWPNPDPGTGSPASTGPVAVVVTTDIRRLAGRAVVVAPNPDPGFTAPPDVVVVSAPVVPAVRTVILFPAAAPAQPSTGPAAIVVAAPFRPPHRVLVLTPNPDPGQFVPTRNATSTPVVAAGRSSSGAIAGNTSSTAAVGRNVTSTPTVSDG